MPNDRFEIDILPKAEKDLDKLKQHRDRAVREILKLESDPY
ncbi:MAG: type II toxin-antitoxin system RelE family toxin [Thermomicrobiales bacterium]